MKLVLYLDEEEGQNVKELAESIQWALDSQPDGEAKVLITGGPLYAGVVLKIKRNVWEVGLS